MSAKHPIVRRIAWSYSIPHLILMSCLILLIWRLLFSDRFELALIYGAITYLVYSFGSKAILLRHHRSGLRFSKLGLFREAISEFQSSDSFLSRYKWIDSYRFLTMLDSSAIPYREMALCNIAYSHIQLGENETAQEYYLKALEAFPESALAKSGLKYVGSRKDR